MKRVRDCCKNQSKKKYRTYETHKLGINKIAWPTKIVEGAIYVDEVGRGAWMGPLTLGACYLLPGFNSSGVHDSKLLKEHERLALYNRLQKDPNLIWHVEDVSNTEIDEVKMGKAWHIGVQRCVTKLIEKLALQKITPTYVVIDGTNANSDISLPIICEAQADSKYIGVAVASNLAKVHRDTYLVARSSEFPEFRDIMVQGKGYAWKSPIHADLIKNGIFTELHRKSFDPLRTALIPKVIMPK